MVNIPAVIDNAWGYALNTPSSLTWRFWIGGSSIGTGFVVDEGYGKTNIAFSLSSDGTTLTVGLAVHALTGTNADRS